MFRVTIPKSNVQGRIHTTPPPGAPGKASRRWAENHTQPLIPHAPRLWNGSKSTKSHAHANFGSEGTKPRGSSLEYNILLLHILRKADPAAPLSPGEWRMLDHSLLQASARIYNKYPRHLHSTLL